MPRVTIRFLILAAVTLMSRVLPAGTGEPPAVGPQGHPTTNFGVRPAYLTFSHYGEARQMPVGILGLRSVTEVGDAHDPGLPLDEVVRDVVPERGGKAVVLGVFMVPDAFYGSQVASSTYRDLADSLGIVVNRSNPVENLSFAELRKIFLGEQSHWSNGRRISIVMLEPGKQERQAVLAQIYRMDDKEFDKHFSQGLSSGEIHATPKTLATSTEVLKYVYNVPGAIGYVRVTEADDSVKILHVDSRLPGDKDYSIRLHIKPAKQ